LDEETQTINRLEKMFWGGQDDIAMDDKDDDHQDKLVFVVLNDTNQLKIHAKNHEIFYGSGFG